MIVAALFLFTAGVINTKPAPVYAEVMIGSRGPYRFLVDTGSETSLIEPKLAGELGLKPEFRVEIITQLTKRLYPGLKAPNIRVGSTQLPPLELVFHDLDQAKSLEPTVRGLLGINALTGLAFTLSPSTGRLELAGARPDGETIPFTPVQGRIAVKAKMGRETLTLILDSGSSHVVLFRKPEAMTKVVPVQTVFGTLEGARAVAPTCWTADMFFTDRLRVGTLPAAIVDRKDTTVEGLLPASVFKTVHVDQAKRELVLVR